MCESSILDADFICQRNTFQRFSMTLVTPSHPKCIPGMINFNRFKLHASRNVSSLLRSRKKCLHKNVFVLLLYQGRLQKSFFMEAFFMNNQIFARLKCVQKCSHGWAASKSFAFVAEKKFLLKEKSLKLIFQTSRFDSNLICSDSFLTATKSLRLS